MNGGSRLEDFVVVRVQLEGFEVELVDLVEVLVIHEVEADIGYPLQDLGSELGVAPVIKKLLEFLGSFLVDGGLVFPDGVVEPDFFGLEFFALWV